MIKGVEIFSRSNVFYHPGYLKHSALAEVMTRFETLGKNGVRQVIFNTTNGFFASILPSSLGTVPVV